MMTEVIEVITQINTVEIIGNGSAVIEVITDAARVVEVQSAGPQGPAGGSASLTPGPGFAIVGNEIRYAIATLSRG